MSEKVWVKHYQEGVPADTDVKAYKSIPDIFEESFKKYASRDCFTCMGKTITYSDLDRQSRALLHTFKITLV